MNTFLIILITALQVGDLLTTEKILSNGGKELNPVMSWLFNKYGMHNVLVGKAVLIVIIAVLLSKLAPIGLIPIAAIYVGVVTWNSYQIWNKKS